MLQVKGMDGAPEARATGKLKFEVLTSMEAIDDIVYLAEQSHKESRFSYITFAPDKVRAIAERALADTKRNGALLCWDKDKPVGFVYCSVGEYHIGTGTLVTTIHNLNVLKDVRHSLKGGRVALGLLNGVASWSKARNSAEILFHVTSDVELGRTHKFIKRLGYRFIGGSYAKSFG